MKQQVRFTEVQKNSWKTRLTRTVTARRPERWRRMLGPAPRHWIRRGASSPAAELFTVRVHSRRLSCARPTSHQPYTDTVAVIVRETKYTCDARHSVIMTAHSSTAMNSAALDFISNVEQTSLQMFFQRSGRTRKFSGSNWVFCLSPIFSLVLWRPGYRYRARRSQKWQTFRDARDSPCKCNENCGTMWTMITMITIHRRRRHHHHHHTTCATWLHAGAAAHGARWTCVIVCIAVTSAWNGLPEDLRAVDTQLSSENS